MRFKLSQRNARAGHVSLTSFNLADGPTKYFYPSDQLEITGVSCSVGSAGFLNVTTKNEFYIMLLCVEALKRSWGEVSLWLRISLLHYWTAREIKPTLSRLISCSLGRSLSAKERWFNVKRRNWGCNFSPVIRDISTSIKHQNYLWVICRVDVFCSWLTDACAPLSRSNLRSSGQPNTREARNLSFVLIKVHYRIQTLFTNDCALCIERSNAKQASGNIRPSCVEDFNRWEGFGWS